MVYCIMVKLYIILKCLKLIVLIVVVVLLMFKLDLVLSFWWDVNFFKKVILCIIYLYLYYCII